MPLSTALRLILREAKPPLVFRREPDGSYVLSLRPAAPAPPPVVASPTPAAPILPRERLPAPSPPPASGTSERKAAGSGTGTRVAGGPGTSSPSASRFPFIRAKAIDGKALLASLRIDDFWLKRSPYKPYSEETRLKLTTAAGPLNWDEIESLGQSAAAIGLHPSFLHQKGRSLTASVQPVLYAIAEMAGSAGYSGISKDVQGFLEARAFSGWVSRNYIYDKTKAYRAGVRVKTQGLLNTDIPSGDCTEAAVLLRDCLREAAKLSGSGSRSYFVRVKRLQPFQRDNQKSHAIVGVISANGIRWPVDPHVKNVRDYPHADWARTQLSAYTICPMSEAEFSMFMGTYAEQNDIDFFREDEQRIKNGGKRFPLTEGGGLTQGDKQGMFSLGNNRGAASRFFDEWKERVVERDALAPLAEWLKRNNRY